MIDDIKTKKEQNNSFDSQGRHQRGFKKRTTTMTWKDTYVSVTCLKMLVMRFADVQ